MRPPRPLLALAVIATAAVAHSAERAHARATDGTITTLAGTAPGLAGDGGPATSARLNAPADVAIVDGGFLVADTGNDRIRLVGADGRITTVAGSSRGFAGDGGPATAARLDRPASVAVLADRSVLIADTFNGRVRRVAPSGTISTVAGGRTGGPAGDGGPAANAVLRQPGGIAVLPDGGYLLADTGDHRIRRVRPDGVITTIAGSTPGYSGDGGPATAAQLNAPTDVAVAPDGSILIADTGNQRVRRIEVDGTIVTIAGVSAGFSGDGAPGRFAQLAGPVGVAPLTNGGVLVSDTGNHRVRRVTPLGTIFTVAGTGPGGGGDGGPAKQAQLGAPAGLALDPRGGFLVADTANARIRRVTDFGAIPPAVLARSVAVAPAGGAVTVQPPGTPAGLALREEDLVPMTSAVDATGGRIELVTARDAAGAQQLSNAFGGAFTVRQARVPQPFTTLRLPRATGCGATARAAGPPKRRKKRRRRGRSKSLWVTDSGGRWRTATGSVTASAIGTLWRTTETCDGTRVTVRQGRVRVRDVRTNRARVVRAGQTVFVARR